MASGDSEPGRPPRGFPAALHYAILLWIGSVAVFYYVRFTFAFAYANLDAIRSLLGR